MNDKGEGRKRKNAEKKKGRNGETDAQGDRQKTGDECRGRGLNGWRSLSILWQTFMGHLLYAKHCV